MLFSQLGTFGKRVGCMAQGCCQTLGGLLRATCSLPSEARAVGGLAPVRGLLSAIARFTALLLLLEPAEALPLSPRRLLLGGLLTPIRHALALVGHFVTVVGGPLSLIRDPVTLIGDSIAHIGGLLALVRNPLALVSHPLLHRRLSVFTLTLATEPDTLALEDRIIGRELRRPALDLRAEALDLGPRNLVAQLQRAGAELV
jgi:hypothetical protein